MSKNTNLSGDRDENRQNSVSKIRTLLRKFKKEEWNLWNSMVYLEKYQTD